jgi:signal peptidase I
MALAECMGCGKEVMASAAPCPHCGINSPTVSSTGPISAKTKKERRVGRAVWGVILSLVAPGLGQVYARSWRAGISLLMTFALVRVVFRSILHATPTPLAVAAAIVIFLVDLGLLFGAAIGAFRSLRRGPTRPRVSWLKSTWLAAFVYVIVVVSIDHALPIQWKTFRIASGSMVPALLVGDQLLITSQTAGIVPARGDVAVFRLPRDPSIVYVKRIVGLPGDSVQMQMGHLTINGQQLPRDPDGTYTTEGADDDPSMILKQYVETVPDGLKYPVLKISDAGPFDNTQVYRVPPGYVFGMGDNRDDSLDSRMLDAVGYIPVQNILGRADTIYFSIDLQHPGFEFWEWPFEIRWRRLLMSVS